MAIAGSRVLRWKWIYCGGATGVAESLRLLLRRCFRIRLLRVEERSVTDRE